MFMLLLAVAGNETTRNATAHGMYAFLTNPDQFELLKQRPRGRIDDAVEEILRWASPVLHFRRTATADTEIRGRQIKAGDRVVIWHISANRDEEVWDDPFVFDITRNPNPHVAFGGGGSHFCLGANLARMELQLIFPELVDPAARHAAGRRARAAAVELHRRHQAHAGEVDAGHRGSSTDA